MRWGATSMRLMHCLHASNAPPLSHRMQPHVPIGECSYIRASWKNAGVMGKLGAVFAAVLDVNCEVAAKCRSVRWAVRA
eukprot:364314-Chlamydomonas_euryale.AAC.11